VEESLQPETTSSVAIKKPARPVRIDIDMMFALNPQFATANCGW
jgi:hypothetical protein